MKMQTMMWILAGVLATNTAWANHGNAEAAKKKASEVCGACHGAEGNKPTAPNFPRLAGQNEDYLEAALKQYRSKQRSNGIMVGQAEKLTDQEIADLATYFSQQTGGVQFKR